MRNSILVTVVFAIFCTSCSPVLYVPNTQNVPMLTKAKQTRVVATGGTFIGDVLNDSQGFTGEVQIAHAIKENVGIMANLGTVSIQNSSSPSGRGNMFELGLGVSKPLGSDFRFETYGVLGGQHISNSYDFGGFLLENRIEKVSANSIHIGIQPAIGYTGKYVECIFSNRISNISFTNIRGGYNDNISAPVNLLFEPALTFRAGCDPVKVQFQVQRSRILGGGLGFQAMTTASLGVTARF
jgi:hypothetical protein